MKQREGVLKEEKSSYKGERFCYYGGRHVVVGDHGIDYGKRIRMETKAYMEGNLNLVIFKFYIKYIMNINSI